jgi:hypothetical protein
MDRSYREAVQQHSPGQSQRRPGLAVEEELGTLKGFYNRWWALMRSLSSVRVLPKCDGMTANGNPLRDRIVRNGQISGKGIYAKAQSRKGAKAQREKEKR